jgi:hypothetical protein
MRFLLAAILGGFFMLAPAYAQHDHAVLGKAGEFYARWNRPDMRTKQGSRVRSCCNNRDCEQATIIRLNGRYYVRNHKMAPGRDVLIPDQTLEHNQPDPRESPDEFSHVCLDWSGAPLCAVLGSGN